MSDINETAAEVLRMVGQMEASCPFQPWQVGLSNNPDDPLPFIAEVGMGDVIVSGVCDENMGEFIVLCCTAAPALAREVQRLQAELLTAHRTWAERCSAWSDSVEEAEAQSDAAYRAGQEAMRERAAAVCAARYEEHEQRLWAGPSAERITDRVGGMADEAQHCAEAIRALEVES